MPDQIRPWVELLTWELLALLAGLALLPAIYIFLSRIKSGKIAGVEVELSQRDVQQIQRAATDVAEESTAQEAAAEIKALSDDEPADLRERLAKAITLWESLQAVVKSRAPLVSGTPSLHAIVPNLEKLSARFPSVLSPEHAKRAKKLKDDLDGFKASPATLTREAYRSFAIRAGRLASKIEELELNGEPATTA